MILAIDPGTEQSGWCLFDGTVKNSGIMLNGELISKFDSNRSGFLWADVLAIETFASYGMAVGKEVFETCIWIGRFQQEWRYPTDVRLVYRAQVKLHLCQSLRAKDKNIRQALIDRLGKPGTKGVTGHAWSALAVAVTTYDKLKGELA